MKILVQLCEIIILKRRPQDISYDSSAAVIAFMATAATSYFSVVLANVFSQPLGYVMVQVVAQAIIFYGLLSITRKQVRFVQTMTALFGVTAILQFITLFLTQIPGLGGLSLLLAAWNFYLMIIILKEAIECSTLQSIILTILYHFVIGVILLLIFPELFEKMQEVMLEGQSAA
ncbi:MAG: hypothetical protein KTR16_04840 [Acidiferrobacterales bacterium]|nr:hypothetical protein [Acidiferrobacterales bacterium]